MDPAPAISPRLFAFGQFAFAFAVWALATYAFYEVALIIAFDDLTLPGV